MNESFPLKKIVLILATGLLASLLVLAGLILSFDDDDYRHLLINAIDYSSDYQLKITGPFHLSLSTNPILSATNIKLHSKTGEKHINLKKFEIELQLAPLLKGILQIEHVHIADMTAQISDSSTDNTDFSFETHYLWPALVIKSAAIRNIMVNVDTKNRRYTLNHLDINEINHQGPLQMYAYGAINEQLFSAKGQLGSLNELFAKHPYSVDIKLETQHLTASLQGQITDALNAKGLELRIDVTANDLSKLTSLNIPANTQLTGSGKLKGELYQPQLKDLNIQLSRGNLAYITASGQIENIITTTGMNLTVNGFIKDPEISALLFSNSMPQFNDITFNAKLINQGNTIRLDNINTQLSDPQGLITTLTGNIDINPTVAGFIEAMNISATLNADTTAAVRPFLVDQLPEMGPVTGKVSINSHNMTPAIEDIDITIGEGQAVELQITGRIGKVPLDAGTPNSDISLDLSVEANNSKSIGTLFERDLPDIGPVTITSKFTRQTKNDSFNNLQLIAGDPKTLLIKASGHIQLPVKNDDPISVISEFKLELNSPSLAKTSQKLGFDLPELGPVNTKMIVNTRGNEISAHDIDIQIGQQQKLRLNLTGNIGNIPITNAAFSDIDLNAIIQAPSTSALTAFNKKQKIPDIGPLSGQFKINGNSKVLQISAININTGKKDQLITSLRGKIDQLQIADLQFHGTDMTLTAHAPTSKSVTDLVGIQAHDFGPFKLSAQIDSKQKRLQLNNLNIVVGAQNRPALVAKGSVKNLLDGSNLSINTFFNEQVLHSLLADKPKELLPIEGNILISDYDGSLGIETVSIKTPQSNIMNARIHGGIDDIINKDEINFDASIAIEDLEKLGYILNIDLPALGPVKFQGKLQGSNEKSSFTGKLHLNKTKVNTQITLLHIDEKNKKPAIKGSIKIPVLYLKDFGIKAQTQSPEQQSSKPKRQDTQFFSQTPIAFNQLNQLDMDINIDIDEVQGTEFTMDQVDMNILSKNNILHLNSARFIYANGQINAEASIDTSDIPLLKLNLSGDDINLKGIMLQSMVPSPIKGDLNLLLDLSGKGYTAHEIASNLNGEIGITLENGIIHRRKIDALFLDIIDWLFTFGITRNETEINCAMARYKINQGVLNTELFYIDGPEITARGKGTANLGTETIDAVFNLEKKRILMNSQSPIHITGNLTSPKVSAIPYKQAILSIGSYFFAPFVSIPTEALGSVGKLLFETNDKSSCQERVARL